MNNKIETLSEEQIAKFPAYVSEWTAHGLCTKPADRPNAEKAICMMYEGAGLAIPKIIWAESPLSGALIAVSLRNKRVSHSVLASVRDSVWDSVRVSVGDSVWDSVGHSVGHSVRASVRVSVGDSVLASVRDSVWDSVRVSVGDSVWDSVGGQHDANWLAFYKFFHAECGLTKETEKLIGLWLLCQSCGWIYPCEGVCIATERPTNCLVDENGQIHAEHGPAVEYPDGFKVYGWHGTRLPEAWVENKDTLDPSEILKCQDVEQRAAGSAMLGWSRMLSHLKHEVVDKGPDEDWGDLLRVWMPELPEPALMLKAECPRNGTICEFVPDTGRSLDGRTYPVDTVLAAQASRVFKHPDTYTHPERRT